MVSPLPEVAYGVSFLLRSVPSDLVHSWCPLALIFCHSLHCKGFAAKRVGEEALQGFTSSVGSSNALVIGDQMEVCLLSHGVMLP